MIDVYMLKSCDTCRKAVKWLQAENINANVIDIRVDGISENTISGAIANLGWEKILNRRSITWRTLDESQKHDMDAVKAQALILENPTLMKRPLFDKSGTFVVGFDQTVQDKVKSLAL